MGNIGFTEVFRSSDHQKELRDAYESGESEIYARLPKTSPHEAGYAFDVPDACRTGTVTSAFAKHGFVQAVADDRVHFEWEGWQKLSYAEQQKRISAAQADYNTYRHPGMMPLGKPKY